MFDKKPFLQFGSANKHLKRESDASPCIDFQVKEFSVKLSMHAILFFE